MVLARCLTRASSSSIRQCIVPVHALEELLEGHPLIKIESHQEKLN